MGIIFAAILSSCMCAMDSQMLAASSALTEDVYRALFRPRAHRLELMWVSRITVLGIAMTALYIAKTPESSIMDLVAFAWSGLGATFGAAVVLSLYWPRTTKNGVVLGMIMGALTVILWRNLGWNRYMNDILPGFVISWISVYLGSLRDKMPEPAIQQEFIQVTAMSRNG
jgi:sodium/proline symporter